MPILTIFCLRTDASAAGATPMQQLQLHQAQVQREQARINEFWTNISKEMNEIDPEKVLTQESEKLLPKATSTGINPIYPPLQ